MSDRETLAGYPVDADEQTKALWMVEKLRMDLEACTDPERQEELRQDISFVTSIALKSDPSPMTRTSRGSASRT